MYHLCSLVYKLWGEDVERIHIEEGGGHVRIQGYFDRSETVYDTPEKWNSAPCIFGLRREENISGISILQMLSTM